MSSLNKNEISLTGGPGNRPFCGVGKKKKTGRNYPCPCGSGKKYKKCCLLNVSQVPRLRAFPEKVSEEFWRRQREQQIKEELRKHRFGKVRPMVHTDWGDRKAVAVGNEVHISEKWKTFHDFLFHYMKSVLGFEWGQAELTKPLHERHPTLQWYQALCDFQGKLVRREGEIRPALCTGPVGAYLSLAYDLYVLRHHSLLQKRLIERLKDKTQFQGARYEVFVAAVFVRAGFEIEFEDETDRRRKHCEFSVKHKSSGLQYSVEAKSRHRQGYLGCEGDPQDQEKIRLRIGRLLNDALTKDANHTRIIFVDINMPPEGGHTFDKDWFTKLGSTVNRIEKSKIKGKPAPPAYLLFTNNPSHYVGSEEVEPQKNFVLTAINIPAFGKPDPVALSKELGISSLWDSLQRHLTVPHEFE